MTLIPNNFGRIVTNFSENGLKNHSKMRQKCEFKIIGDKTQQSVGFRPQSAGIVL